MSYKKDYWIRSTSSINCSHSGEWWHVEATSLVEAVNKWCQTPFNFHDSAIQVEHYPQYNKEEEFGPDKGGEEGRVVAVHYLVPKSLDHLNEMCLERRIACVGYPPSEAMWDSITLWEIKTNQKFPWREIKDSKDFG